MGFRNKSGKLIGFDVDLANATFKKLGIKVEWEPINPKFFEGCIR